jgi:hypothetical protein
VLLVVVENFLDGLNTWVVVTFVGLASVLLIPVKNLLSYDEFTPIHVEKIKMWTHPSNEWTNQRNTGLSACDCLTETKQQCQITVDPVIPFQFPSSLDTLPSGRNLDQNTIF